VLALVALATGTVLRARHFFTGQSLWLDEAMLALNILGKSCREMFGALSYDQFAPPLYLCAARALALPLGGSEMGLRLSSVLAGIVTLVLVWRVGRRLLGVEAAALATWLLAISPLAIAYANETKPYMLDAMIAIVLVGLAWQVIVEDQGRRRIAWLAIAGLVALLASFTAPFVLAGVGLVMLLDGAARRESAAMRRAVGLGLLWLMPFLLLYFGLYGPAGSKDFLPVFWDGSFLVGGPEWRAQVVNAVTASLGSLPIPDPLVRVRYLLPLAALLGALAVRLAGGRVALLLLTPNVLVLLASTVRLYPVADRLVMFLGPATVLLCAGGLVAAARAVAPTRPGVRAVLFGLLVAGAGIAELRAPSAGPGGERVARDVVRRTTELAGPAPVLLVRAVLPAWLYYTTDWRNPDTDRLDWFDRQVPFQSATFAATGDSPPDPPLAVRTPSRSLEGRVELVASPSGVGLRPGGWSAETFPAWGREEAERIAALGAAVVWVHAARTPELEALAHGWTELGGAVWWHDLTAGWRLVELRAPAGAVAR
jgi:hypothetical protein